jgi:hypothetical protein
MVLCAVLAGCVSQEELATRAKADEDPAARRRAVERLHDPELLLDLAMNAEDRMVRLEATRKLGVPHLEAIGSSPVTPVLRLVDYRLSNVEVDGQPFDPDGARLTPGRHEVSATYNSWKGRVQTRGWVTSSRFEAVPGDVCVVWAVVLNKQEWFVKSLCVAPDSLPSLWRELPGECLLGLLEVPEFSDRTFLNWVAMEHSDASLRAGAAGRIEDPKQLLELAGNDESGSVRFSALKRLGQLLVTGAAPMAPELQGELAVFAMIDEFWRVREAAVRLLTDRAVLVKVAETDEEGFVRQAVAERLEELDK